MYYIVLYIALIGFDGNTTTSKHYLEPVSTSLEGCEFIRLQLNGGNTHRFLCEKRTSSMVEEE